MNKIVRVMVERAGVRRVEDVQVVACDACGCEVEKKILNTQEYLMQLKYHKLLHDKKICVPCADERIRAMK